MISNIIPSGLVIRIMNILSRIKKVLPDTYAGHLAHNRLAYKEYADSHQIQLGDTQRVSFIENQNELSKLVYGSAKGYIAGRIAGGHMDEDGNIYASFNICEILALYNAYAYLGRDTELPEFIENFERDGVCFGGVLGTSIRAILQNIELQGLTYELCKLTKRSGRRISNRIKNMEKTYSCFILMMWNDGHLSGGVHTVCITRGEQGYSIHNPFSEKENLIDAIFSYYNAERKCFSKPIALIGIK